MTEIHSRPLLKCYCIEHGRRTEQIKSLLFESEATQRNQPENAEHYRCRYFTLLLQLILF